MSGVELSLRSAITHPKRVLAVWAFCVATIAFWAAVVQYLAGLPVLPVVLVAAAFGVAAIPFAGRLTYIVWEDAADG